MGKNVLKYKQKKKGSWRRSLLALALTLVFFGSLALYLTSPLVLIEDVVVRGNDAVDTDELLTLAGLEPGMHLWRINLSDKQHALSQHPWLAEASIRRQFPNSIVVEVAERQPVAAVSVQEGGWLPLSADGVVLTPTSGTSLPFLTGIELDVSPGDAVETDEVMFCLDLLHDFLSFQKQISEVNISHLPLYFVLYTTDGYVVKIWAGDDYTQRLDDLTMVLAQLRMEGVKGVVDLRTRSGQVVFSPYETDN